MPLAFIFLCWRCYQIFQEYSKNLDHVGLIQSLFFPLACIMLLSQSGAPAKHLSYALRDFSSGFGVQIMQAVGSDASADAAKAKAKDQGLIANRIVNELQQKFNQCRLEPSDGATRGPTLCQNVVLSETVRQIKKENLNDPILLKYVQDLLNDNVQKLKAEGGSGNSFDLLNALKGGLPGLAEQLITSILNAVTIGFYWAIELTMILLFYLLPIALAMGVLDSKAIFDWFAQFWGLCNAKICYAIVVSLITYISTLLQGIGFVIPLLMAFFAPAVTFMFAKGSVLAMAEGMSQVGNLMASSAVIAAGNGKTGSVLSRASYNHVRNRLPQGLKTGMKSIGNKLMGNR
jgi:hypothetical protein